jgi:hypothetical protein
MILSLRNQYFVLRLLMSAVAGFAVASVGFGQTAELHDAPELVMPSEVDSNSPAYWLNGELRLINSTGNGPVVSRGQNQLHQSGTQKVWITPPPKMPTWMEAVWMDSTGILFGWYHQEDHSVCPVTKLAVPRIGAAVSYDGGASFKDLGFVLASGDPIDCSSLNGFFAGGHGDFSVVPDRSGKFFYFLFSNYGGARKTQGVAVARMAMEDRFTPVGRVLKYFDGSWSQPGLGGAITPIFRAKVAWQRTDTNAFWGPSVHWNTYLGTYVMLLNHSCCTAGWPQKDVRVAFNPDLAKPDGWSVPQTIVEGGGWYPQVLGIGSEGTDSVAGRVARLYMYGRSGAIITFQKPKPEPPAETPPPAN